MRKEFTAKEKITGSGLAFGIIIGSVIGALTDNLGL